MKPQEREYVPIYNRKLARSIIRADYIRANGQHNVSQAMAYLFKQLRSGEGVKVNGHKTANDNEE